MPTRESRPTPTRTVRWNLAARARTLLDALEHLVGGLGTAVLAVAALLWLVVVAVASLFWVGLFLVPTALRAVRAVADRERARLSRWGPEILGPPAPPDSLRAALTDPMVPREVAWLVGHATSGLATGMIGVTLPFYALQDGTFPLWWRLLSPDTATPSIGLWTVHDQSGALGVGLLGLLWATLFLALAPALARWQAWPGRRLLGPPPDVDLSLRVAELTATRAAALDAHAMELRRIERSLHDGTQNRLVAVTVLLGAARRALDRQPADAAALLDRAQDAAEQALAELRTVARSILPPVLADRGLVGALTGLATTSAVPCQVDVDVPGRCAASVEATAYFVVAEALTNVSRHSGATHVTVTVRRAGDRLRLRVRDDGRGGADARTDSGHSDTRHGSGASDARTGVSDARHGSGLSDARTGSGLSGIRRRVEAHDGTFTLTSPPGGPTTLEVELPCGS